MPSLNDLVADWGLSQTPQLTSYDEAKTALVDGLTQDQVAVFGGADSYNAGLELLASGGAILSEATLWLDARRSVVGEQSAINRGTGGSALDARYGSTTGADTNDPLFLSHTGENYMYLPGLANNSYSVPDPGAFTDLDVKVRVALDSWTAANQYLAGQWADAGGNRSWYFGVHAGTMRLQIDALGTFVTLHNSLSTVTLTSVAAPTPGQRLWLRVTHDGDNGAGGSTTRFYYAQDAEAEPSAWTQLGADVVGPVISPFNAAAPLTAGLQNGASTIPTGSLYAVSVSDAIGGDPLVEIDFTTDITDAGATSFTATSGQTVTVNRATSGRKTALVTRPIWLFGTDDYLEVADDALLDFGAAEDFTVLAVVRQWATPLTFGRYINKRASSGAGYLLQSNNTALSAVFYVDGTVGAQAVSPTFTAGALNGLFGVRNTGTDQLTAYLDDTAGTPAADASTTTLENPSVLRVGSRSDSVASPQEFECVAVAVWRRVLTTDEIAAINTYYGTA